MALVNPSDFKFQPGQVIQKAQPFLYCISASANELCATCFKPPEEIWPNLTNPNPLKVCAGCHQFRYCSQECQANDWKKFHKYECKMYATHATKLESDFCRAAVRLALILEKRPDDITRKFKLMDGNERSFTDLKEHLNEIKKDEEKVTSFTKTFALLKLLGVRFNAESLFVSLARMCINSFSILDTSLNEKGTGLYIETSIFDHSCVPNAAPVFNGSQIQVRAIKHILADEPVTINYVDCKESRSSRQTKLYDHYYFTCQCSRCTKEANEGEDTSICSEIASLDKQYDDLVSPPSQNTSDIPWNECYMLLIKTLPFYEHIYGEFHPDFTVQLMRCLKVRSNIDFVDGSDSLTFLVNKLSQAIHITHGKDHPLYNQFKDCFNCE